MKIQYYSKKNGWWTGASKLEIPDPEAYVAGLQVMCRILDNGLVLAGAPCTICNTPHDGLDGSCLL